MKVKFIMFFTLFVLSVSNSFAQEPMIGEIKMFAGNFAPRGWAFCDGQLLPINQYPALYSILGTTYGGDGKTTFGLPDLRGRTPVHADHTNDLGKTSYGINKVKLGQKGGSETIELGKVNVFENNSGNSGESYTIKNGNSMLYKRDPYLGVYYIIALNGIFPSRN